MATKTFCDRCGSEEKTLRLVFGAFRHGTPASGFGGVVPTYEPSIGTGLKTEGVDLCATCQRDLVPKVNQFLRDVRHR